MVKTPKLPEKAVIPFSDKRMSVGAHTILKFSTETDGVIFITDTLHEDPNMVIPDPTYFNL